MDMRLGQRLNTYKRSGNSCCFINVFVEGFVWHIVFKKTGKLPGKTLVRNHHRLRPLGRRMAWRIVWFQDDRCLRAKKDEVGVIYHWQLTKLIRKFGDNFFWKKKLATTKIQHEESRCIISYIYVANGQLFKLLGEYMFSGKHKVYFFLMVRNGWVSIIIISIHFETGRL